MATRSTQLHGSAGYRGGFASNLMRWQGHWSKELKKRRARSKVAKRARKRNRG